MELHENIYTLRKKMHLSQEDLAEKIEVSRQTISNWELGITSPNPKQLILLSKVFDISVDELIGNDRKQSTDLPSNNSNQNRNEIPSSKTDTALFTLFMAISIVWGVTSIICIIEMKIDSAIIDLSLCIVWSIISYVWYNKKIK